MRPAIRVEAGLDRVVRDEIQEQCLRRKQMTESERPGDRRTGGQGVGEGRGMGKKTEERGGEKRGEQ